MIQKFWRVVVDAPLFSPLTYVSNASLNSSGLQAGIKVSVPLGKRYVEGIVIAEESSDIVKESKFQLKEIKSIVPDSVVLHQPFLNWMNWLTHYYFYPPGQLIGSIFPKLKKQGRKSSSHKSVIPSSLREKKVVLLSDSQLQVINAISAYSGFSTHLVFGVTGSGKTEVYMSVLQKVLQSGKNGIVIVPEISLTPQLTQRFVERFGDQVAVLHSQLTDRERTDQWWAIIEGRKRILVGARSALFCPVMNLGIIIVDEEHEASFKQEEKLKYNARDSAVMRGYHENCPVVLGSATPSLETWKNCMEGKYHLHRLPLRVASQHFPEATIVDLKAEKESKAGRPDWMPSWMSPQLYQELEKTLGIGKQSALFLNRRGFANVVICPDCGFVKECPNCEIALTLHGKSHLVCHYCDYREDFDAKCSNCSTGEFRFQGLGTEQIEEDIKKIFPQARVARADRDEIDSRESLEALISSMELGEVDILIGTQMIAKGLDFPNLITVGIILADIGLHMPDFRASERSFQLITQVSGRAGRHLQAHEEPGKVIIQTYNPEHYSIVYGANSDFEQFAKIEIENRKELGYPPFGKMLSFRIQGIDQAKVRGNAIKLAERARFLKEKNQKYEYVEVLGPAESPLMKVRNNYRFQVLLKGQRSDHLNAFCRQLLGTESWIDSGVKILVDVDPINML